MKAPISVCLIVRNEIAQIESCLRSIRPYVEEICVVDTGSTDGTYEIVKTYADIHEVFTDCNDAEGRITDFSQARERSFKLARQPWTMWVDGDDEVAGGDKLYEITKRFDTFRNGSPCIIMLPYDYSFDAHGNVTCKHYRERLITPKNIGEWKNPVHEVYVPNQSHLQFQTDEIRIVHKRDFAKKPTETGRNLRILKALYDKIGESDPRQLYYLGLECGNTGDLGSAIKFHTRYIELSGWDDEKFLAGLKIAEHYQFFGDYDRAVDWALKILTIREGWAEAYFSLAKSYYFLAQRGGPQQQRNWEKCIHFAKLGLTLPETQTSLFVNPTERKYDIHRYLNFALSKVNDVQGALESAETGLRANPEDGELLLNIKIYKACLARAKINESLSALIENKEIGIDIQNHINEVLDKKDLSQILGPHIQAPVQIPSPVTSSSKPNVSIYAGPGVELWNPETAKKNGIGGSETAVIEMSKRLAQLGHSITVYGSCEGLEGTFDGVRYLNHTKYQNQKCDVLITSRRPDVVDDVHNVERKATFCWVHDVHCGSILTHDRALRIDKFLVLSEWHKQNMMNTYAFIHPSQFIVTRNGIDLNRFNKTVERNPHRAVYSSSPDRGMQVAICIWPRVRERIPGAELHLYYGFQTWEVTADEGQKNVIKMLKQMISDYENAGVTFHGRVSQDVLAEEYLKSGVWTYPTWFSETSCLSAMEAHAAGVRMVTTPIAALNETVGDRGTMVHGDWLSLDYQNRFIDSVVEAMSREENGDRKKLQQHAQNNFGWDSLAQEWSKMFDATILEVRENIMPPYKGYL